MDLMQTNLVVLTRTMLVTAFSTFSKLKDPVALL